jgi:hypothetical protein
MSGLEKELIMISGLFEPDWYRTFYSDVADSGLDPITHYLRIGGKGNRHPSRFFDAGFYVSKYPDVTEAGRECVGSLREVRIVGGSAKQESWRATAIAN